MKKLSIILFLISARALAVSSDFDTATSSLFVANSQVAACGGIMNPIDNIMFVQGVDFSSLQRSVTPTFSTVTLPANIGQDVVNLANREAEWVKYGYSRNLGFAQSLHRQIAGQGVHTALFMTYLTGIGPTQNTQYRNRIINYWKRLETDLESTPVNGFRHDVLLIPVLELWEWGRRAFPIRTSQPSCSWQRGFQTDALHATRFGQYAVSMLITTFLTCNDPHRFDDDYDFPASYKKWARDAAWNLFNSSYMPDHC